MDGHGSFHQMSIRPRPTVARAARVQAGGAELDAVRADLAGVVQAALEPAHVGSGPAADDPGVPEAKL